jgi:DNA-binding response OmpR family regulator
MRLYLPEKEFAVSEARDGMAGLKLLREHEFDLIVLDLIMPECDGMQFIRSMRNAYFTTRILAVSGAAERALYLHMAAMLGANLICEKPITRERFYDGLRQLRVEFPNRNDLRLPDNNSRKLC